MPEAYTLQLGIDSNPFFEELAKMKQAVNEFREVSKQSGVVIANAFTAAGEAQTKIISETTKAVRVTNEETKAIKETSDSFKGLFDLLSKVSGLTGKSFDPALIKLYSTEITKAGLSLKDLIASSQKSFDPAKLALLNAELQKTNSDFEEMKVILSFIKNNIGDLKLSPGSSAELVTNINLLEDAFKHAGEGAEQLGQKEQSARARLRELKNELATLDSTDLQFPKLVREAAELQDKISDVNATVNLLGSDTSGIDTVVAGVQGLVGVFAAAQGAAALFGDQNEELSETMKKLYGVMTLLTGIQQIGQLLDSKSRVNESLRLLLIKQQVEANAEQTASETAVIGTIEGETAARLQNVAAIEAENAAKATNRGSNVTEGAVNTVEDVSGITVAAEAQNILAGSERAVAEATIEANVAIEAQAVVTGEASLAAEGLAASEGVAKEAQLGLNAAILANPVGVLLIALGALFALYEVYITTIGKATEAEKRRAAEIEGMVEAEKKAADAIAKEQGELNIWLATAKSEATTRAEKQDTIDKIKQSYPEYLNSLSLENLYTKESSVLIERQIGLIKQRAIVQAAQDVYVEKLKAVAEAQAALNEVQSKETGNLEQIGVRVLTLGIVDAATAKLEKAQQKLKDANIAVDASFNVVKKTMNDFAADMGADSKVFDNYIHQFDLFAQKVNDFNPVFPTIKPFDPKAFDDEKKAAVDAAEFRLNISKKGTIDEMDARRHLIEVNFKNEINDKRKTDAEKKIAEGKYLNDIQALNEEYQARSLKDALAFANYKILLAKEGSKQELDARLKAVDVELKEQLSAAGITNGESLKLKLEAEKKKEELNRQFRVTELQNEIANQQILLNQSIEGSKEEFIAKKKILELQSQVEIENAKGDAEKILLIKSNLAKAEDELTKQTNAKTVESGLNKIISDTNARLDVVEKGSANELALKNALVEQQAELEKNAAGISIHNAVERAAKIMEIESKANAEILHNTQEFIRKRIEAETALTTALNNLEIARLQAAASNPNISEKKKFELQQQIREIELQEIINQDKEIEKLRQADELNDAEYQTKKTNILAQAVAKRAEIINADTEFQKTNLFSFKKVFENIGNDIFDSITKGMKDADKAGLRGAFDELIGSVTSSIGSLYSNLTKQAEENAQAQIDSIDRVIEKTNEELQIQQDVVDREQELSDRGLANDLGNQQKRLDDIKAKKQEEIKQREAAAKNLEKIRKQEAVIQNASIIANNIETGVNMINAASKIFKAHAGIPFAGVVIAIGLVALMASTFLAIKNAFKTADPAPKFRQGGGLDLSMQKLKGPSHEQGGFGLYNEQTGKKVAEYEGGEVLFAINKNSSEKYDEALNVINLDRLATMLPLRNTKEFQSLIATAGRGLPMEAVQNYITIHREVEIKQSRNIDYTNQFEELKNEVKTLRKDYNDVQETKEEVTDHGDYYIVKSKGRTRKVWKKRS